MKFNEKNPPRTFKPRKDLDITIKDLGDIQMEPDEQLCFVTNNGSRYDFVRKDWGFYATPSINDRLVQNGFKTALVRNEKGQVYLMVVEASELSSFMQYCTTHRQQVLEWVDETYPLNK